MDLEFNEDERAFQLEVRQFLTDNLPPHIVEATKNSSGVFLDKDLALEWQAILVKKGWAVPSWPLEHGGTGWTPEQKYLFTQECYLAGAPMLIPLGLGMLAPVIIAFGTEEQKARYLPKMLNAEHYWCQGYSEPGSGSDLASLKLRAESEEGSDCYIVNGSKLWTTHAQFADHIFCLVRTDTSGKPQHGISFLLIDMDSPGVSVEPIITMAKEHEVNQVFFEDVRVPKSNLIGEENAGWSCAKYLLEFERGGGFSAHQIWHHVEHVHALISDARALNPEFDSSGQIRRRLGRIEIDLKSLEITELRVLSTVSGGGNPGPASSVNKLTTTRLQQEVNELAKDIVGYQGLAMETLENGASIRPDYLSSVVPRYLNNRAASIFGGSQEVQKNIIAKMVMGL
ncbi:MAG: acyl-CoA dehydrogenase family protein [Pseudomonadales bacterium]